MGIEDANDWADLIDEIQDGCEHDWDEYAGQTQVAYNGSFELLDVCTKCGDTRHTGKYDSVL